MTEIGPPLSVFDVESKELKTAREAEEKRFEVFRVNGVSVADLQDLDDQGLWTMALDLGWEMNHANNPSEARKLVVFAKALQRRMARSMLDPTIKTAEYNQKTLTDAKSSLQTHQAASAWTRAKGFVGIDAKTNRLTRDIENLTKSDVDLRQTWSRLQSNELNIEREITRLIQEFNLDEIDKPEPSVSQPSEYRERADAYERSVRIRDRDRESMEWVRGLLARLVVVAPASIAFGNWLGRNGYVVI